MAQENYCKITLVASNEEWEIWLAEEEEAATINMFRKRDSVAVFIANKKKRFASADECLLSVTPDNGWRLHSQIPTWATDAAMIAHNRRRKEYDAT